VLVERVVNDASLGGDAACRELEWLAHADAADLKRTLRDDDAEAVADAPDREWIWVMDRGIQTGKHLAETRQRGALDLVGTPKGQLTKHERELATQPWREARPEVLVKLLPSRVTCTYPCTANRELAGNARCGARSASGCWRDHGLYSVSGRSTRRC
jgi:hypothetical protein